MAQTPDSKRQTRPWRENIEAMTMAIVVAVMLKYFVVEAYKIPTGSMQPTLMGNEDTGIFDRILVDKFSFHVRDPERFEIVVFKYPLDRSKNFIKRLVGMPGEHFRIADGDLWTRASGDEPWKVLRRPDSVQGEHWKRIDPSDPRYSTWKLSNEARSWRVEGRSTIAARGAGEARLPKDDGPVWDRYSDGYPSDMGSKLSRARVIPAVHRVGDLRLEGAVTALPGLVGATIELRENSRRYRFVLPGPAAPAGETARILVDDPGRTEVLALEARATPEARLRAGERASFLAQNCDDRLRFELDGVVVAELDIPSAEDQSACVFLRTEGEGADFAQLELSRDVYYTSGTRGREFIVPEGNYLMLGDNTQDSSDSREWAFVNYRWSGEPSKGEWIRGNFYPSNIPLASNPLHLPEAGGPRVYFRDEWGELHDFPLEKGSLGPQEEAPYVPRELIVGRAVLVFWPLGPFAGDWRIWRLQWAR
jgi:signal peptidase I